MTILKTRLFKPQLNAEYVQRSRLLHALDAQAGKPLIVVNAPAGYGKSVLVSQWLEEFQNEHAWLSLDEHLNVFHIFLENAIEAIENVASSSLSLTRNLLRTHEILTADVLIEQFVNDLAGVGKPMSLILDDYHLISAQEIHTLINTLIKFPIEGFQVVIISRHLPPIQMDELRAYDRVFELGLADLSFNHEECIELIKSKPSKEGHVSSAKELLQLTEGWVMGLVLALSRGLHGWNRSNSEPILPSKRTYRFLLTQLIEPHQAEEVKAILLASLCDRFNKDLLDHLFAQAEDLPVDGNQFMDFVQRSNFFVVSQDKSHYWFRYHHLVRDLLRQEIIAQDPGMVRNAYGSICQWFENHGFITEAIEYAIRGEDYGIAVQIIERHRFDLLDQDKWWVLQECLSMVPADLRKNNIELLLAQLWVYEDTFQVTDFQAILKTIEVLVEPKGEARHTCEYYYHCAWYAIFVLGDAQKGASYLVKCDTPSISSALYKVRHEMYVALVTHMITGYEPALKRLKEKEKEYSDPRSLIHIRLQLAKMFILLCAARLEEATDVSKVFQFLAEDSEFEAARAYSFYFRGVTAFQYGELEDAEEALERALACKGVLNYRIYFDAFAAWAILKALSQQSNEALSTIEDLLEFGVKINHSRFIEYNKSIQCRLQWLLGGTSDLMTWSSINWRIPRHTEVFFAVDFPELTKVRCAITYGPVDDIDTALGYLKELEASLHSAHNYFHDIDILVLQTIGYYRKFDKEHVSQLLPRIVKLTGKRQHFRPLLEMSMVAPHLVMDMDLSGLPRRIHSDVKNIILSGESMRTKRSATRGILAMSQREQQVVILVAQGFTNKQIGERMNISEVTVKSHLTNIFRKLHVQNRVSMVRKITSLNLIDVESI